MVLPLLLIGVAIIAVLGLIILAGGAIFILFNPWIVPVFLAFIVGMAFVHSKYGGKCSRHAWLKQ